jgi:predicted RNA-binding Zn-ribbon protein involved in translation (DUF1610 family)
MSTTFHEPDVVDNLKKILNHTCKKISNEEEISEYFCPCGYVITETEKDQKNALTVMSNICGF